MIIMALDHTRDYFHKYSFYYDPLDVDHTTVAIYFTRWITHFCAPVFVFLAGTSAFLVGTRKSKKELSKFIFTRGLWLMFIEVTVVCFGWFFNPLFSVEGLQVIWALGACMVLMAALIHLPYGVILGLGVAILFGHNLLDTIHVPEKGLSSFLWSELHERNRFVVGPMTIMTAYPILPWLGVMSLGYCFGKLYIADVSAAKRKRTLLLLGSVGIALFVLIRYMNIYGNLLPWTPKGSFLATLGSFLNTTKYPPSLDYVLMTLSPAMLVLAFTENMRGSISRVFVTYGRVPFLYYILHIYLIHIAAVVAAQLSGFGWTNMVNLKSFVSIVPALKGYGFTLPVVYLVWLGAVACLYPLCKRYEAYKRNHKEYWWLSYL